MTTVRTWLIATLLGLGSSMAMSLGAAEAPIAEAPKTEAAEGPAGALPLAEGEARIFLARADGSELKRLTDLPQYGLQGSPTWSADGKLIAFDACRTGESTDNTKIVVVDADGKNPRILIDGAMPSFSPAARRMAFSRYGENRGVWVMSSEGPEKELVLLDEDGWSADWSPDGSRIAYSKRTGQIDNVVVFDLIEGTTTQLFEEEKGPYSSVYWNFLWSPDSREIVFRGIRDNNQVEVAIVDARGAKHGLRTILLEKENRITNNFAWRPDGQRLLLSFACPERQKRPQLYAVDPRPTDNGQPHGFELLPGQNPAFLNTGVAYSPDGQRLAISCRRPKATPAK